MIIKYVIAALATVVVVGGGAAYYIKDKTVTSDAVVPVMQNGEAAQVPSGMSLKDLLAKTTSTKCTVSSSNDLSDSSGIVYIANGKMRSDFTSTMKSGVIAGRVNVAHMIVDTDYSYMWGEGVMKVGIKMEKKDILDVKPEEGKTPQNQAAMDMNEKSDYHCDSWRVDDAQFIPPSTIEFQDVAAMVKGMPGIVKGSTIESTKIETGKVAVPQGMTKEQLSQMCGQCDTADAGREQCRTALGCK